MRPLPLLVLFGLLLLPAPACGDGGVVRALEKAGPYRVTVFTSPTPLRAGPIDISVLVQDGATGKPISDSKVILRLSSIDPSTSHTLEATHAAATNKLYQAAQAELTAGTWSGTAEVSGPAGAGSVPIEFDVGNALPPWTQMTPWIALPLLPIVWFVLVQAGVRKARNSSRPGSAVGTRHSSA